MMSVDEYRKTPKVKLFRQTSTPLESPTIDDTPPPTALTRFTDAKSLLATVFTDLYDKLLKAKTHITAPPTWVDYSPGSIRVVLRNDYTAIASHVDGWLPKVSHIIEAVSREEMKVVFIGRTSAGKSTTINAMLHHKILPSGVGHTTDCFCALAGTDDPTPYLITPGRYGMVWYGMVYFSAILCISISS